MATWSGRRKFLFGFIFIILAIAAIGVPAFLHFYTPPSCTDKTQNGDELGVDCGGSCTKLCSSSFIQIPGASWVRFREVAPQTYSIAAYIVNPNPRAAVDDVPYKITFYDKDGFDLRTINGTFSLTPGRSIVVFRTGVKITDQKPTRAVIEYPQSPDWYLANDKLINLSITDKRYKEDKNGSYLDVILKNDGNAPLSDLTIYAILKDADSNVIDFSQTIVDRIAPMSSAVAPFTWPASHNGEVISIEVVSVPE